MSKRRIARALAALAALACLSLVVAACGGGSSSSSEATGTEESSEEGGSEEGGSSGLSSEEVKWGTAFLGGAAGKAESGAEPFVIGFANQQGGTPSYPGATKGAEAAVKLINEQLGGIEGRPIELKTCFMLTEEDGQKCGAEFLADKSVQAVVLGLASTGNASLYKTVVPKLPVIVGTAASEPDISTPGVYAFNGGSLAPIAADGVLAAEVPGAKDSAVIYSTNPIGTFVATEILKPTLEKEKLGVKLVGVGDTATAPEVQSAIQAVGAQDAQVFQMTSLPAQCLSAYQALAQEGIEPAVVTTYQCIQPEFTEGNNGELPEGWVLTGYGESPRIPNLKNGRDTYVAAMEEAGFGESDYLNGDASLSYTAVLMMAKMAAEEGPKASPKTIEEEILKYRGEIPMAPGTPECGTVSKKFAGLCTTLSTVEEVVNGKLIEKPAMDMSAFVG